MTTLHRKQHLPNLDALRFIAFLAVFMAHAWHPVWDGMRLIGKTVALREWAQVGVLGVNFFFVLSGFLIGRLLLIEKNSQQNVSVWRFYVRRMLRIWPLYFLIIVLTAGYYNFIRVATNTHWTWIILFATNFHIIIFGFPYAPALANLWTIAVEEQFYLSFPWLLKAKNKWFLPGACIAIMCASIIFRALYLHNENYLYFHSLSIMGDFAAGVLLAWFSLREKFLEWFANLSKSNIILAYIVTILTLIFYAGIFNNPVMIVMERIILSGLFGFVIMEQVFSPRSFMKAGSVKGLSYSGKISYGLYMYHAFALQAAAYILQRANVLYSIAGYMILYPLVAFGICYFISVLSFELMEKKILSLKKHFWHA